MTTDGDAPDAWSRGSDSPAAGSGRPRPGPGPGSGPARLEPVFPLPVLAVAPPRRTRRWFLAGTAAVLIGAGGGVGAEFLRKPAKPPPNPAPRDLVDALAAEEALLADASRSRSADTAALSQIQSDHRAHLQALHAALAAYDPLPRREQRPSPRRTVPPISASALRKAESQEAHDGAARAARLRGRDATLLASIAACEATHAELLT
ncbi:MAG TPA: hypothetical protein VFH38_11145 [Jatrophihabitans sp.]|nr:hypothetical protein [Jatrophihabitans sp.]